MSEPKVFITPSLIREGYTELCDWLVAAGAQPKPTRKFELLRFKTNNGMSWVKHVKPGSPYLQFHGEALPALMRYFKGLHWSPDGYRPAAFKTQHLIESLKRRDGTCCMFCGEELGDDVTVEHWVPSSFGGPTTSNNMALMHKACNLGLGNLPVTSKLKLILAERLK